MAEEMQEVKMSKKVREQLHAAIIEKSRGTALEKEGKAISKKAGDDILPILLAHDIKSYALEGVGKVMEKVSSGSKINGQKLTEELLKAGLTIQKINNIITRSSSTWSTPFVEFRAEK